MILLSLISFFMLLSQWLLQNKLWLEFLDIFHSKVLE